MTFSPTWLFRDGRAVLWLVLIVCCATPTRAAAGCGDYVTIQNDNSGHTPAKPPCHGPHCSGKPEAPPPFSPIVVVSVRVSDPLHIAERFWADDSLSRGFGRDTTSPRPIGRTTDIFHPPRSV